MAKIYSHQVATSAQLSTTGDSAPRAPLLATSNVGQPQDSKPLRPRIAENQ
ncbi:MAG: hypothetical protein K2X94_05130 [Amoebophilaceae bacterium]|nr:hypothetical protein [Amoebophilaceae bacterium]